MLIFFFSKFQINFFYFQSIDFPGACYYDDLLVWPDDMGHPKNGKCERLYCLNEEGYGKLLRFVIVCDFYCEFCHMYQFRYFTAVAFQNLPWAVNLVMSLHPMPTIPIVVKEKLFANRM